MESVSFRSSMFNSNGDTEQAKATKSVAMKRTPFRFLFKYGFALSVILTSGYMMYNREIIFGVSEPAAAPILIIVLGLMFAHFTELQHELLHGHAFKSEWLSRLLGALIGLFMLSNYSHYRYSHLRHHRYLGTSENEEFFEYPKHGLNSVPKLVVAAMNPHRFASVFRSVIRSIAGLSVGSIKNQVAASHVRQENILFGVVVLGAVIFTLWTGSYFLVLAWGLPLLLVAEPVHYLIELPEHFGLDVYAEGDVSKNTRSIDAGPIARWFTNGNNLHTIHHAMSGIPMDKCAGVHRINRANMHELESSYLSFYAKVIQGKIVPFQNGTPLHH